MTKAEYFLEIKSVLEKFLGLKLDVPIEGTDDISADVELPSFMMGSGFNFIEQMLEYSLSIIESNYNKGIPHRFHNIIEQICCEFLHGDLSNVTEFIDNLKELSVKTYENCTANLGILVFGRSESILSTFEKLNIRYIPFSHEFKLNEMISTHKLALKLIDGESIIIICNNKYHVVGIAIQNKDSSNIKQKLNLFLDENEKKIERIFINSYFRSIFDQSNTEVNMQKVAYETNTSINLVKEFTGFYKLMELEQPQIHPQDWFYIEIYNQRVNLYVTNTPNNYLTIYNGMWKVKSYTILKFFIFEVLFLLNGKFILNALKTNNNYVFLDQIFDSINILVSSIKELSKTNRGSLFIILEDNNNDNIFVEEVEKQDISKLIPKTLLLKKLDLNNPLKNVIYNSNARTIKLNKFNSKLLELIAEIDGAVIFDSYFNLLSFGELINSSISKKNKGIEGSRSAAAIAASKFGIAIKVSEDGDVTIWYKEQKVFVI